MLHNKYYYYNAMSNMCRSRALNISYAEILRNKIDKTSIKCIKRHRLLTMTC